MYITVTHVPFGLEGLVGAGGSWTSITSPRHVSEADERRKRRMRDVARTEGCEVLENDRFIDVVANSTDEDGFLGLCAFLHLTVRVVQSLNMAKCKLAEVPTHVDQRLARGVSELLSSRPPRAALSGLNAMSLPVPHEKNNQLSLLLVSPTPPP